MAKLFQSLVFAMCLSAELASASFDSKAEEVDRAHHAVDKLEDETRAKQAKPNADNGKGADVKSKDSAKVEENEGKATETKDAKKEAKNVSAAGDFVKATRKSMGLFHTLYVNVNKELHDGSQGHQIFNGVLSLVVGVIMVADGEFIFRGIVVFFIFTFTSVVTTAEFHTQGLHGMLGFTGVHVVAFEVSAVIAYAAFLGFRGIKVILGCLLGFFVAFCVHKLLFLLTAGSALEKVVDSAPVLLLFGTAFCFVGIWLVCGRHQRRLQAFIGCFFGGTLLSSALGFFMVLGAVAGRQSLAASMPWIPATVPAWIDFLKVLLVPHFSGGTVGIFASSSLKAVEVPVTILLVLIWILVSVLGWKYQMKQEKQDGPCMTEKIVQKMASQTQIAVDQMVVEVKKRSKTPPRTQAKEALREPLVSSTPGRLPPV